MKSSTDDSLDKTKIISTYCHSESVTEVYLKHNLQANFTADAAIPEISITLLADLWKPLDKSASSKLTKNQPSWKLLRQTNVTALLQVIKTF